MMNLLSRIVSSWRIGLFIRAPVGPGEGAGAGDGAGAGAGAGTGIGEGTGTGAGTGEGTEPPSPQKHMLDGQNGEGALQLLTHQVFIPVLPVHAPDD